MTFFINNCFLSFSTNIPRENLRAECELLLEGACQELNLTCGTVERDEHGKPFIEGQNFYFSFSHSKDVACCAVCKEKPVGVDIQFETEKLLRAKERFLNEKDFFHGDDIARLCQMWCIKEAVFKASTQHLTTLQNIFIKSETLAEDAYGAQYEIFCSRFENFHYALAVHL